MLTKALEAFIVLCEYTPHRNEGRSGMTPAPCADTFNRLFPTLVLEKMIRLLQKMAERFHQKGVP